MEYPHFFIGNTSSIRVHFPASYVRLPECNLKFDGLKSGETCLQKLYPKGYKIPAVLRLIGIPPEPKQILYHPGWLNNRSIPKFYTESKLLSSLVARKNGFQGGSLKKIFFILAPTISQMLHGMGIFYPAISLCSCGIMWPFFHLM